MSCNIFGTINLECIDSIGGIETIYYIQKSKVATISLDTTTNMITGITFKNTGVTNKFQEIQVNERSSSWVENNQFNLENGAQGWEIVLTAIFSKSDADTRALVSTLVKTKCYVIIKNNDGRYFLLGYRNGGYFNGGDYNSGKALGDRNGYQLIFTTFENNTATEVEFNSSWVYTAQQEVFDYQLDITSFNLTGITTWDHEPTINHDNYTISGLLSYGNTLTDKHTIVTVNNGSTISPVDGTHIDYTNPVNFIVTNSFGMTRTWTVTITVTDIP